MTQKLKTVPWEWKIEGQGELERGGGVGKRDPYRVGLNPLLPLPL